MKRVAVYARVSTDAQTTQNQLQELHEVAAARGWEIVKVYQDQGVSGAKGREGRPALDAMLKDATRGKFDLIATWAVDRLGRSLANLASFLLEIHTLEIDLYVHKQGMDTTTPAGKAMFGLCSVFAEFERDMIRERTIAGLARARAAGKVLGRPSVASSLGDDVRALKAQGLGINKIAAQLKIGARAVRKHIELAVSQPVK